MKILFVNNQLISSSTFILTKFLIIYFLCLVEWVTVKWHVIAIWSIFLFLFRSSRLLIIILFELWSNRSMQHLCQNHIISVSILRILLLWLVLLLNVWFIFRLFFVTEITQHFIVIYAGLVWECTAWYFTNIWAYLINWLSVHFYNIRSLYSWSSEI